MYSPETSPSYLPKFMRGNEYDACPCKKVRFLALTTSAAFAGVAFYVNAVGHPARLELDNANALKQWKAMYARAAPMQASLATISGLVGAVSAYKSGGDKAWILGAALMLANIPYTLLFIMPLNKRLLATPEATIDLSVREDLNRWAKLHAVRTVLGIAGTIAFIYALSK